MTIASITGTLSAIASKGGDAHLDHEPNIGKVKCKANTTRPVSIGLGVGQSLVLRDKDGSFQGNATINVSAGAKPVRLVKVDNLDSKGQGGTTALPPLAIVKGGESASCSFTLNAKNQGVRLEVSPTTA